MYTKGEWKVTSNKLAKVTFPNKLTVRSNTGCPIALLTDAERSTADAHLIAAAPRLYEACNQADWLLGFLSDKDWNEEIIKTREQLRQASSKAEVK